MSEKVTIEQLEGLLQEVKKKEMELTHAKGVYDEKLQGFLREAGLPEQFTLLDLVITFSKKSA